MKKVRKMVVVLLMVFGAVSVSMGAWIPKDYEENYQKLKAEVEEVKKALKNYQNDAYCEFEESPRDGMCEAMNVVAFFDEIRATEGRDGDYDDFAKAVKKVREIPRFKNDSGIYSYVKGAYFNEKPFWERVWYKWKMTKLDIGVGLAKQGVFDEWKDGK